MKTETETTNIYLSRFANDVRCINCQLTKIVINPGSQFRGEYFSKNLYFCTTPKKALHKKAVLQ